jgi:hypothetical protein
MTFAWRNRGYPWETSVRITGVLVESRTEYLLNTRKEHYRYTGLLGFPLIQSKEELENPAAHVDSDRVLSVQTELQHTPNNVQHNCLNYYLLTYLRSSVLPEKLLIVQPVRKFPAILRNPKVHHRVHNWSLSCTSSIPPIPSHPKLKNRSVDNFGDERVTGKIVMNYEATKNGN